jgi:hypothetical protein
MSKCNVIGSGNPNILYSKETLPLDAKSARTAAQMLSCGLVLGRMVITMNLSMESKFSGSL